MAEDVLYIGTLVNDAVRQEYDLAYFSRAANNKKRGVIESLQACDAEVSVVSPMFVHNNSFRYHGGRTMTDEDLGVSLHVPPTMDIYGLNYVFLAVATSVVTLTLLYRDSYDAIIFYNFQLETATPALLGSLLFSVPTVLEYEDGLFLHDNAVIRWASKLLRPICGPFVRGAACVNRPLADLAPTENTTVIRGFPSIGMPDELPDPTFERDETVVMFAGRFDEVRGVHTFLDIVPQVSPEYEDVVFWVSGYGPDRERERVESHIEALADDRLTYFGTLPWVEYKDRIVSADIVVNCQDPTAAISEYTFPSKLLDFMAAGALVVSTDMSDLEREFGDKIVVDGHTERELVETLTRTIETEESEALVRRRDRVVRWIERECPRSRVGAKVLALVRASE